MQSYYFGACYVDGRIYSSPRNAPQAMYFDLSTKTFETFGDVFPATVNMESDKWGLGSLSSFDNCIYAFPMFSPKYEFCKVLKIDPAKNTACEVGEDILPLADGVTENPWVQSCANGEGYIFAIPCCGNSILRFDPRTNAAMTFGQLEDTGLHKYWYGVAGPSGRHIFCPPALASRVLCIDTQELTIELIGPDFGRGDDNSMISTAKYLGATLGADSCIYSIPFNSHRLLRIEPVSNSVSLFGPDLLRLSGSSFSWFDLCSGMDGCMYAAPFLADRILRIDPFAGTVSSVGEAIPPELKMMLSWPVLDKDGAIWCCPLGTPMQMVRLSPRRPNTALLATMLEPQNHVVLREGLLDLRCYGPAIAVALWREAVRLDPSCSTPLPQLYPR